MAGGMSDAARREFLARLERPFRERAPNCVFEYGRPLPFPCLALTVVVPGRPGSIRVTPASVWQNTKSWADPFPGEGIPHWDLYALDDKGQMGEHFLSCDLERIVDAFGVWIGLGASVADLRAAPPSIDHLWAIGKAKEPAPPQSMQGEALTAAADLPHEERRTFESDASALAARRIARFFPRDDQGLPEKRERVLLAAYGPTEQKRRLWLHVTSAKRGTLKIGLESLIGENHVHRWDGARWMWDARVEPPSPNDRWGIRPDDERAQRSMTLLDEGRFSEALALFEIRWTPQVAYVLAGESLSMHDATLATRWAGEMRRALWELAPWKLQTALDQGVKSGRLFTLGGQHHIRKASLMLARVPDGGVELRIEHTGTNARLPRIAYCRSLEQDLARFEIAAPEIPIESVAPLTVETPKQVNVVKEIATLTEKLRHPEPSAYDAAIKAGRKLEPSVASRVLEAAMEEEDPRVRRRAFEVASSLRNEGCIDTAMKRLDDSEWLVRNAAADFLRKLGHVPLLAVVAQRMLTSQEDFLTGASTLRNWGEKRGNEALRKHLASHDANIRAAACLALVQYGGKVLVPLLVELVAKDQPVVAGAALYALDLLDAEQRSAAETRANQRADAREVRRERKRWEKYRRI